MLTPDTVALLKKWCDLIPAITPFDVATVEERLREFAASEGIKISDIIHPLRIVLTGKTIGLGFYDTAVLLAPKRTGFLSRRLFPTRHKGCEYLPQSPIAIEMKQ